MGEHAALSLSLSALNDKHTKLTNDGSDIRSLPSKFFKSGTVVRTRWAKRETER